MQRSVLSEVILSLDDKEIRELNKWLHSPAHNHREDAIALFECLVKNGADIEKEAVWRIVFPKQPFDDAFLRQVMYFLLKAIEDYLLFKEYKKEAVRPMLTLASIYRRRHLDKSFRQTLEAAKRKMLGTPIRNSEYHLDKFNLEQEQYFYLADGRAIEEVNLQEVSNELDLAFVANKLRIACRMISHQAVNKKVQYQIGMIAPILEAIEQGNLLDEVGVAVYYYGYRSSIEREQPSHFENLWRLLQEHQKAFPNAELRELYLLSINYCINRINAGQELYFQRAFEIYNVGFGHNILLDEKNTIDKILFTNTVYCAIKTKNFAWAESFIEKFGPKLGEKHPESTIKFNQARLYYERGEFDNAQTLLRDFDYDDLLLNLIAKNMLLKIYYKTDEFDALESLLESMRSYLQRKEAVSPVHKLVFKNIIGLMKKLVNLNTFSKAQVEKFRQAVRETSPLQEQEREWFLQQVAGR